MRRVGFIGVGDMGMGMARNIVAKGFELTAYDIRKEPLEKLAQLGAHLAISPREVGETSEVVFIVVLDGAQVKEVVMGKDGLLEGMKSNSTIVCTSTILPSEMKEVASAAGEKEINVVDSPVSGGAKGAVEGTLTMMVAARKDVFESCKGVLQAVGRDIYHVGEEIGMGQMVKASLTAITGTTFAAMAEALVLGARAGISPEALYQVISTSVVGSFLFRDSAKHIMERNFRAGSHIRTIFKDLGITMRTGRDCGVPLFVTGAAYEMFQAAKTLTPDEDAWAIIKVLEGIVGVEVRSTT